jgi:uncharacterized membrane protein AbrB (regulator of aidB expression)
LTGKKTVWVIYHSLSLIAINAQIPSQAISHATMLSVAALLKTVLAALFSVGAGILSERMAATDLFSSVSLSAAPGCSPVAMTGKRLNKGGPSLQD